MTCNKRVYHSGGSWNGSNCSKPPVVEVDGKSYCKIHDPAYVSPAVTRQREVAANVATYDAAIYTEGNRLAKRLGFPTDVKTTTNFRTFAVRPSKALVLTFEQVEALLKEVGR